MADSGLDRHRGTIAHSVVFDRLAPVDLDHILGRCQLLDVDSGQVVLSEGQPGDGLYIILQGRMEFVLPQEGAKGGQRMTSVRLNTLGPGRCFGEYSLIDDSPCSATVRALVRTQVCFLPRRDFRQLVDGEDRVARVVYGNLLRFLVSRLRTKDQELDTILLAEPRASAQE